MRNEAATAAAVGALGYLRGIRAEIKDLYRTNGAYAGVIVSRVWKDIISEYIGEDVLAAADWKEVARRVAQPQEESKGGTT